MLQFVHEDGLRIISELKSDVEIRMGKEIADADVEMLLINAFAYRELLMRTEVNSAGRQMLLRYANGVMLDLLGELLGVVRLPASHASCVVKFSIIEGHGGVVIPINTRIQTTDGKVSFATTGNITVPVGINEISAICVAEEAGAIGNEYAVGDVSAILDPLAFLFSAENTQITKGGSDPEDDEGLRGRIKLAPSTFSVAGSEDAYRFHAKSANGDIVDIQVLSSTPGTVNIYPLMTGGALASPGVLSQIEEKVSGKKVRPLTDTVIVANPDVVDYDIEVNVTIVTGADASMVKNQIETSLGDYKEERKERLGLDVVVNKIRSICMTDGVYDVEVELPSIDLVIEKSEYAKLGSITINIIGSSDE